jgi:integrase
MQSIAEHAESFRWRPWSGTRKMAGLTPDATPHILRHTCATLMLQAGVSTWDVAGVLGTS